jgi:glutamine synthetase
VGGENVPRAPRTLIETSRVFLQSEVARDWLGDTFVEHYAATRDWEWRQWQDAVTDWELKRYFEII